VTGLTNGTRLYECFLSLGMGLLLGALYTVFQIVRAIWRCKAWQVFVQDVLYFALAAVCTFLFLLSVTDGVWRWYIGVCLLLGFFAWRVMGGRLLPRLVRAAAQTARRRYAVWAVHARPKKEKAAAFFKKSLHWPRDWLYNRKKLREKRKTAEIPSASGARGTAKKQESAHGRKKNKRQKADQKA